MSLVKYANRQNTNCRKWDYQVEMFGQEGLLPFWIADMDFESPECVKEALQNYVTSGVFGYYKEPNSYYEAFINWERQYHSYEIKKEWLRFSPGIVAGFNWIIRFMTKPQDSIIVLTPVYYPFLNAVTNNNRNLITSELINTNGIYSIDFEDFEKKIVEHNVSLFIHCSPHNPIGRVWTELELKTLFDICRKHNVFVISDEIHQDFVFETNTHIPAFKVGNYEDMMITLCAASKTFNLAGGQNSNVIIPNETIRQKWDTFANELHVLNGSPFGYIATEAAFNYGRPWLEEVKQIILENYYYMKETLTTAFPNIIVTPLEGTFLSWIDMSAYLTSENIKDFMENKCHLAFDYGDWFGGTKSDTFIRMNLATSKANVEKAVNSIIANMCLTIDKKL